MLIEGQVEGNELIILGRYNTAHNAEFFIIMTPVNGCSLLKVYCAFLLEL